MPDPLPIPRCIAIATHPTMPAAVPLAAAIVDHLQARGLSAFHGLLDDASGRVLIGWIYLYWAMSFVHVH